MRMTPTSGRVFEVSNAAGESEFGGNGERDLYLRFALTLSKESGASYFAQAYIPTQPAQAIEDTRISRAHEDPGRQESNFPPTRQGAQAGLGKTRFPRLVQRRGEKPPTRCYARHLATPCCASDLEIAIWKLRVTVTACLPGESKRDVEPRTGAGRFPRSARVMRHADFERVYKLGRE